MIILNFDWRKIVALADTDRFNLMIFLLTRDPY